MVFNNRIGIIIIKVIYVMTMFILATLAYHRKRGGVSKETGVFIFFILEVK